MIFRRMFCSKFSMLLFSFTHDIITVFFKFNIYLNKIVYTILNTTFNLTSNNKLFINKPVYLFILFFVKNKYILCRINIV